MGLEPRREGGSTKWARPESAQLGKGALGQISLMFFLKNYEISVGLHSDGPNELMAKIMLFLDYKYCFTFKYYDYDCYFMFKV